MTTPPTRRRGQERKRSPRATWLLAALVALVIGAIAAGGTWWAQRDDSGTALESGEYVPPSEIATSSSTSTSSTSSTTSASRSSGSASSSPAAVSSSSPGSSPTGSQGAQQTPSGEPTRVQVDSGGKSIVDANLQATKLDSEKVLAPPFGTAGWYAEPGWPKPGHQGASILVGHINHGSNPDVFWNLPQVEIGDVVTVTYGSGTDVKFKITRSEAATKGGVPQDDSIWDHDNPDPVLRLITCDPETPLKDGHYEGNWVVWADQMV